MAASLSELLALRKNELQRRMDSLPNEIATWQARSQNSLDMNAHFSQLNAINTLVSALITPHKDALMKLDPVGASTDFTEGAFAVIRGILLSQKVWDYFRSKLELRFLPEFKDLLWTADTVAWDCYRPVMDRAVGAGIVAAVEVREPPLTYLTAEFSPATWVRGSRPNDGRNFEIGQSLLPIPTIELPWDQVENVWDLLSLHHEVGHDIEADLKLHSPLLTALEVSLRAENVPEDRIERWLAWQGEIFADLVGMQLAGPAFGDALLTMLLLPREMVVALDEEDPHPTHYVRILLACLYIPTLVAERQELKDHAERLRQLWLAAYGAVPEFDAYLTDFPAVYRSLMDTPFDALQGMTVRQLMPFSGNDDQRIRNAGAVIQTGQGSVGALAPRHCVSAARMAINAAIAQDAAAAVPGDMKSVHEVTLQLIKTNATPGVRGASSALHQKFVAKFAEGLRKDNEAAFENRILK